MDYFKVLPAEITVNILSQLPAESIMECKSVSKSWNDLISHHRSFYQMYLQRLLHMYYTRFVGSCNGLICIAQGLFVCICNPITREYVVLPEFKKGFDINFGYVSSTNEYKVVGVCCESSSDIKLHIYTLGSDKGWRNLGDFKSHVICLSYRAIFANETLYWMDSGSHMFITFDLAEEKFCENISLPPSASDGGIGVLDGFLYVAHSLFVDGVKHCYDIWLLKQKSVNSESSEQQGLQSWSREFRVGDKELLAVTKRGGVLTYVDNYINIYDTKTSTSRRLVKFKNRLKRVCPHQNTLVSLKELGEEDIKVMKSIEIEETKSSEQPSEQLPQHSNTTSSISKRLVEFKEWVWQVFSRKNILLSKETESRD